LTVGYSKIGLLTNSINTNIVTQNPSR